MIKVTENDVLYQLSLGSRKKVVSNANLSFNHF